MISKVTIKAQLEQVKKAVENLEIAVDAHSNNFSSMHECDLQVAYKSLWKLFHDLKFPVSESESE